MLRQVGRGALQHSVQRKFVRLHATPCFVRLYSIPTSDPSTNTSSGQKAPLPLPPQKKPKIDLRPGPIKPKPPPHAAGTAKIPPSIPTQPPHTTTEHKAASPAEEVKKDLQDAEQHGILIPPPADANWFKRTLHQAIQLFVCGLYFVPIKPSSNWLTWCARNSTTEVSGSSLAVVKTLQLSMPALELAELL